MSWDRPVARLRYHGAGGEPLVVLRPPRPIPIRPGPDAVEAWVHGNRWDWEAPPDTPPLSLRVRVAPASGAERTIPLGAVRWKEWWLVHHRLSVEEREALAGGGALVAIEAAGGTQKDDRDIHLDSLDFTRESPRPLSFAPRPRPPLAFPEGRDLGLDRGPGVLPFPTREETILPPTRGPFRNEARAAGGGRFEVSCEEPGGTLVFDLDPARGLAGLRARFEGAPVGDLLLAGGGLRLAGGGTEGALVSADLVEGAVEARWASGARARCRGLGRSLVVDVEKRGGDALELVFGRIAGAREPRRIHIPPITYGGGNDPQVLLLRAGGRPLFVAIWLDWYRSAGSEPWAAPGDAPEGVRVNGGVRYHPRTDGRRNDLFERFVVSVSPDLEEVLPVIPNPPGLHAREAAGMLWQETWGPSDLAAEARRGKALRARGIEKLIRCNHETSWRDGGESFTLRTEAAPGKGGDAALRSFVASERALGFRSGLYTNYTDFAPVNAHWDPDLVQRTPEGEWRPAWPRCYALKPAAAVELDALLAPRVEAKFGSDSAYTDVHTAVAPWAYCDYDARVPGAGCFASTFYAYGQLLRNDSAVYRGPIFSEGTYQWLYAGLADGNYGLVYDGLHPATEPLLPVFDLREIHTRECDIGMGWTSFFCDAIPDWKKPERIDRAIDRFILHTIAYGHIGWLVEEAHGWERTCRSYYMLQALSARYALLPPDSVRYFDGKRLVDVSAALVEGLPASRRQLRIEYPGLSIGSTTTPPRTGPWRRRAAPGRCRRRAGWLRDRASWRRATSRTAGRWTGWSVPSTSSPTAGGGRRGSPAASRREGSPSARGGRGGRRRSIWRGRGASRSRGAAGRGWCGRWPSTRRGSRSARRG